MKKFALVLLTVIMVAGTVFAGERGSGAFPISKEGLLYNWETLFSNVDISGSTVNIAQPISVDDNGNSLTVDSINLDIRDLIGGQDSVSVVGSTVGVKQASDWYIKKGTVVIENQLLQPIQDGGNVNILSVISSSPTAKFTAYQADKDRTISGSVTTLETRTGTKITVGVDVSSTTYYTVNSRSGRLSLSVKNNDSDMVYVRESNTNILINGTPLDSGETYYDEQYTGALYVLTEAGKAAQNIRIEENYIP